MEAAGLKRARSRKGSLGSGHWMVPKTGPKWSRGLRWWAGENTEESQGPGWLGMMMVRCAQRYPKQVRRDEGSGVASRPQVGNTAATGQAKIGQFITRLKPNECRQQRSGL